MILSKDNLKHINTENVTVPNISIFNLPEKVLQFGTGVLLRGLPDYFIDKANRAGVFNGRVVVVKSTGTDVSDFEQQNALYTLCIRGVENGNPVSENIISSAISRVISAERNWERVLKIAESDDLKIVISNTTEVGIQYHEESISNWPPISFPAKLLAVLYQRYKAFNGDDRRGLIIIPTELIADNGTQLKEIIFKLAQYNQLDRKFIAWLVKANTFCNSLVDRIVPGKPESTTYNSIMQELGYEDQLLAMAEPYRLWAIEGGKQVADELSFAKIDTGVIITTDIELYKELKIRLLNGTHTISSGIAFLLGIDTVKAAMTNKLMKTYIENLLTNEIGLAIPYKTSTKQIEDFINAVKDRFANPYIAHQWSSIAFQYSMKLKMRVLPTLLEYYKKFNQIPVHLSLGFAAYLVYSHPQKIENEQYYGAYHGVNYLIKDESASYLAEKYNLYQDNYALEVLNDTTFWGTDLKLLAHFIPSVLEQYQAILEEGMEAVLSKLISNQLKSIR